jgi:hypothetical protein
MYRIRGRFRKPDINDPLQIAERGGISLFHASGGGNVYRLGTEIKGTRLYRELSKYTYRTGAQGLTRPPIKRRE